jgi:hypothetical protein
MPALFRSTLVLHTVSLRLALFDFFKLAIKERNTFKAGSVADIADLFIRFD